MTVEIVTLETSGLGDRSYLAHDGASAVVVDPQRDIDRVLDLVARLGVSLVHVAETHVHNDYVSGGLDLARRTGATYLVPAGSGAEFDHTPAHDGDAVVAGGLRLRVLHTPGHTHHHVSYVLDEVVEGVAAGDRWRARAVFTGGSMLFGSTGRTDLVGPEHTEPLAHAQFHSVRRLAAELPADVDVLPTHGFGSFCSATPTSGDSSTVGEQLLVNPALTQDEQEYVDALLAGLTAVPAYYARMAPLNRRGPAPVDLSTPRPVDAGELRERLSRGEWVVDLRARRAFAAGHLAGSLGFELSGSFVTYLGWLHEHGAPLTLLGESAEQVADARRELVRIGIDDLAGAAVGDVADLADGQPLRSYRVSDFAGLAEAVARGPVQVVDARRRDERAAGHVPGSLHVPLPELSARLAEVPAGEVWVYCASGYRASIAASLLDGPDRRVVLVDDSFDRALELGLARSLVPGRV